MNRPVKYNEDGEIEEQEEEELEEGQKKSFEGYIVDEEIVPKSYADIFDMALTPENLFPDANIRQQYLDQLINSLSVNNSNSGKLIF